MINRLAKDDVDDSVRGVENGAGSPSDTGLKLCIAVVGPLAGVLTRGEWVSGSNRPLYIDMWLENVAFRVQMRCDGVFRVHN